MDFTTYHVFHISGPSWKVQDVYKSTKENRLLTCFLIYEGPAIFRYICMKATTTSLETSLYIYNL
jgi:hypothetical protein